MMKYFQCVSGVSCIVLSLLLVGCAHQANKTNKNNIKGAQVTASPASSSGSNSGSNSDSKVNKSNIDPFQKYNRMMFRVNTGLNNTVFEPVVDIYDKSTPSFIRETFHNFFSNIQMFPTIGNDLLQANFRWAGRDFMRLFLNTSLGGLGLVDVASSVGLYSRSQSFGLTLGKWGVQDTPYLVLPVLGPSSVRGAIGLVPDFYMTPINYLPMNRTYWILKGVQYIQIGSDVLPKVRFIMDNSLDPYVAMRNAYTQNQHYLLEQVREEQESLETGNGAVQFSPMAESGIPNQNHFAAIGI
jgi:phospholipid-binding lipoprotein MlaA